MPLRPEVHRWLSEAASDLKHAEKSIENGDYNWSCFASQQAAEKSLKAFALHTLGEFLRGHDLVALYRRVKQESLSLDEPILSKLSVYYTLARYPNAGLEQPSQEISKRHALEALETAVKVYDTVSKALRDP